MCLCFLLSSFSKTIVLAVSVSDMDANPDIVAIGVEELVDLNASNIVKARSVSGNIQTTHSISSMASVSLGLKHYFIDLK